MLWFWKRPVFKFYQPDADSVFLVVEDQKTRWRMKKGARGVWNFRAKLPAKALHGRAYHFEVHCNGDTYRLADPLARRALARDLPLRLSRQGAADLAHVRRLPRRHLAARPHGPRARRPHHPDFPFQVLS